MFRIRVTGKAQSMRHRAWYTYKITYVARSMRLYTLMHVCVSLSVNSLRVYTREGSARPKSTLPQIPRSMRVARDFFFSFSFFFFFFFFPPFASPYLKYLLYTLSTYRLIRSKLGYRHRHRHHYPIWLLLFANIAAILPSSPLLPLPPSAPPFWTS